LIERRFSPLERGFMILLGSVGLWSAYSYARAGDWGVGLSMVGVFALLLAVGIRGRWREQRAG